MKIATSQATKSGKDIGTENCADDVAQVRNVVDVGKGRCNHDVPLSFDGQDDVGLLWLGLPSLPVGVVPAFDRRSGFIVGDLDLFQGRDLDLGMKK